MELLDVVVFLLCSILFPYRVPILGATELSTSKTPIHSGGEIKGICTNSNSANQYCDDQIIENLLNDGIRFYSYKKIDSGVQILPILSSKDFIQEEKRFKFITHGFLSSCDVFEDNIIPAYLEQFWNIKVYCIDWSKDANPEEGLSAYDATLPSVPIIATKVANLIHSLVEIQVIQDLANVHIVGFSLGAQLIGNVGSELQAKFGKKLGRITGLDPAGPGFNSLSDTNSRLDKSDADFVDILHTCSGILGTSLQCGHADFYINGGKKQPHCLADKDPVQQMAEMFSGLCSHQSARLYYAKSIKNTKMKACNCNTYTDYKNGRCTCDDDSKATMGEYCDTSSRGKYFIDVRI